jgi:site-specific DNA-methyltransferase (adenine-specific)
MTSPPYWGKRLYQNGGIGLEATCEEYLENLLCVFREVKRVLKPSGSFNNIAYLWLLGIP